MAAKLSPSLAPCVRLNFQTEEGAGLATSTRGVPVHEDRAQGPVAPKGKIDVLVALIRPFPPRSHPKVTIAASGGGTLTFDASMAAAGAAVLLPDEVSAFAAGKWQTTASLSVVVKESDSEIKGLVALNGLREAYHSLLANCSQ
jgi:hypothetical protein